MSNEQTPTCEWVLADDIQPDDTPCYLCKYREQRCRNATLKADATVTCERTGA
jgi:hypothetical protein